MRLKTATVSLWWLRYPLIGVLATGLLLIGYYDHALQDWLTLKWQLLAHGSTGWFAQFIAVFQRHTPQAVAKRPLPVLLLYLGSYLTIALLLLRLLLPQPALWRLAWRSYAGLAFLYAALLLLAKVSGGHLPWAYPLARLVVELLGTPIPLVALTLLLRYGTQAK